MLTSEWCGRLRSKSSGQSFFARATCTSSRRTPSIGTNNNKRLTTGYGQLQKAQRKNSYDLYFYSTKIHDPKCLNRDADGQRYTPTAFIGEQRRPTKCDSSATNLRNI